MKRIQISWETWGSSMLKGEKRIEEVQSEVKRSESHSFVSDSLWPQGGTRNVPFLWPARLARLQALTRACLLPFPHSQPLCLYRPKVKLHLLFYCCFFFTYTGHLSAFHHCYWFHCYSFFRLPVENCFCKTNVCKSAHFPMDSHFHFRGMIRRPQNLNIWTKHHMWN